MASSNSNIQLNHYVLSVIRGIGCIYVSPWLLTHVNPIQLMASANMSPSNEGKLLSAGKYACICGLCQ